MMTPLKLYVENKFAPSSVPLAEAQVVWSRGTGSWFLSPIRRESLRAKLTKMMAPLESKKSHVNILSRFSHRCGQQQRGLDFVANYAQGYRLPRRRVVGFCGHPSFCRQSGTIPCVQWQITTGGTACLGAGSWVFAAIRVFVANPERFPACQINKNDGTLRIEYVPCEHLVEI